MPSAPGSPPEAAGSALPPAGSPDAAARLAGLLPAHTRSPGATEALGARIAARLVPGDVLLLHGDLGAGKTHLVRGLVAGLGGDPDAVSSPTFTLVHPYPTAGPPVVHIDAYRLGTPEEFLGIGGDELLEDLSAITVIEWPERIGTLAPPAALALTLVHAGASARDLLPGAPDVSAEADGPHHPPGAPA